MQAKKKLAILVIAVCVIGFGMWHVLKHRSATRELRNCIAGLNVPDSLTLQLMEVDTFLISMNIITNNIQQLDYLDVRRSNLSAESTWLQNLFVEQIDEKWKLEYVDQLNVLIPSLPQLYYQHSLQLSESLLSAAPGYNTDIRQMAVMYKAHRIALKSSARKLEQALKQSLHKKIEIDRVIDSDNLGAMILSCIDRSSIIEQKALKRAKFALKLASSAAKASSNLRKDAPSNEIAPVVSKWRKAYLESQSAVSVFNEMQPPRETAGLYRGLVADSREKVRSIESDIQGNLNTITSAYQASLREESTLSGRLSRFGRRTARSVKQFVSTSITQLENSADEIARAMDMNMEKALVASVEAVNEGVRRYEDSRKPDYQLFLESPEGLMILIIGGGVFVVIGLGAIIIKGGSASK